MLLTLAVIYPIVFGALLFFFKEESMSRRALCRYTGIGLVTELIVVLLNVITNYGGFSESLSLTIAKPVELYFISDETGRFFLVIMCLVWVLAGFYAFEYMKHEEHNRRFFGFYLMTLGALAGLCEAGNMITYYAFYEFMTLLSFALVLHNQSTEAIMAALKYMLYSFAGAYMVLFGIYFVSSSAGFSPIPFTGEAGALTADMALKLKNLAMLLMIMGFSVKAGMFPLHGWLPTAHPVAPAPASSVLSAIIVKAGVLGIIRTIYFVFGREFFDESSIKSLVLVLSLITVFMGSMLAYREQIFKKRLAYSTVSQVSYILFGLFMATDISYKGALIHVYAHAAIKSALFLIAGAIIYNTGCTRVSELRGIGKKMPVTMWCFTICSLGLIGIPPLGGFISKWYLGIGALSEGAAKPYGFIGIIVLLVSALLTAGYLLPVCINAFLPGKRFNEYVSDVESEAYGASAGDELNDAESEIYAPAYLKASEPKMIMLLPVIILTLVSVLCGLVLEAML